MKARGFTLIEVLVALAIMALALGTALRATTAALAGSADIRDRTLARWAAKNELARLQAAASLPAPGTLAGETRQGNVAFSWRAAIETTPNPNFNKVDVVVTRPGGSHELANVRGYVVGSR